VIAAPVESHLGELVNEISSRESFTVLACLADDLPHLQADGQEAGHGTKLKKLLRSSSMP
jgi:hypothetical protein